MSVFLGRSLQKSDIIKQTKKTSKSFSKTFLVCDFVQCWSHFDIIGCKDIYGSCFPIIFYIIKKNVFCIDNFFYTIVI